MTDLFSAAPGPRAGGSSTHALPGPRAGSDLPDHAAVLVHADRCEALGLVAVQDYPGRVPAGESPGLRGDLRRNVILGVSCPACDANVTEPCRGVEPAPDDGAVVVHAARMLFVVGRWPRKVPRPPVCHTCGNPPTPAGLDRFGYCSRRKCQPGRLSAKEKKKC